MNESYQETKNIRSQIQNYSSESSNQKIFNLGLSEEQRKNMTEITNEILSDDPNIVYRALSDFNSQLQLLSVKVVSFLFFPHIKRLIDLLRDPYFCAISLRILSQIRQEDYSIILLDFDFLEFALHFIKKSKNPELATNAVIIVTNNSLVNAKFRNKAFEQKIFNEIYSCKIIDPKLISWSLKSALEIEPYGGLNIEEEITYLLIKFSENPDNSFTFSARHKAINAFILLKSRGSCTYRHVILENRYIHALTDVCISDPKPEYRKKALSIISSCCIDGDECLMQIFNFDTIDFYSNIINKNEDDDYMVCFADFLINSILACDCTYISIIVDRFCSPILENFFINHSSFVYTKAAHAIQCLFCVTENPDKIAKALTPNLIMGLSDLLFISDVVDYEDGDAALNVLCIYENILMRLVTLKSAQAVLKNVIFLLTDIIQREEYYKFIYEDENQNVLVQEKACIIMKMVNDLLPKDK